MVSDIVARMHIQGALIDKLRISFRAKRPNLDALSQLFDTDIFHDIDNSNILQNSISLSAADPLTIKLTFDARRHSKDTKLYKVGAFIFKGDLLDKGNVYEYKGPSSVIYNQTNNCVKGLDEEVLANSYVMVQCNQKDYEDPRLARWIKSNQTIENTQLKTAYPNNFIYCYEKNITLNGQTYECPPYVFKLNVSQNWQTPDMNYIQEVVELQPTKPIEIDVHKIHFKKFTHNIDTVQAINKVKQLREQNNKLFRDLEQEKLAANKRLEEL